MSKLITICIIFFFSVQFYHVYAQQSVQYHPNPQNVKLLNAAGDTLANPWTGGHESPQFSNIDLNGDGVQDLFAFDRAGSKIVTYIGSGNGNYIYVPAYETLFPQLHGWAFLVDYNHDNRADIFTYRDGGIAIFKNESVAGMPRFRLMTDYLTYGKIKFGIYSSATDIPSIKDMDGDGDIDILVFDIAQTNVFYFKNQSYDSFGTNYARYDSLYYMFCDSCWGRFHGGGHDHPSKPANIVSLPEFGKRKCAFPMNAKMQKGNNYAILALDVDDDSDNDLLIGDYYSSRITLLYNGRIQGGQQKTEGDSMFAYDTLFPANTVRPDVPYFAAPFHVDADHDGKRDLLITPQYYEGSANTNQIFFYKNTGTDRKPVFNYVQNNFLVEKELDLGRGAAPAFFDYDGDSLPDLVVATAGDFRITRHTADRLILFKNYGTAQKPVFKAIDNDYLNISRLNRNNIVPAFGDLNADGKPDLLLGGLDGTLVYYRNTTATGQPATFVLEDSAFGGIDVGEYSAPAIADLRRTGLADLVVGKKNGMLNYYKNIGTPNLPKFKLLTDSFGMVRTAASYYDYEYNPDNTIKDSTLEWEGLGLSSPVIADINKDGKWDLVSGSNRGRIYIYLNIEDKLLKYYGRDRNNLYNPLLSRYENKSFGSVTYPAIALLNGNTLPDIVIGNEKGGLNIYGSYQLIPAVTDSVPDKMVDTVVVSAIHYVKQIPAFKIFPNPATGNLYISGNGADVELNMYNMLGQNVFRKQYRDFPGNEKLDISGMHKGVYLLRISNGKELPQVQKIIIE